MVASAARRRIPFSGIRPLDATRDLVPVADLIAVAFRDDMDSAGERAVREMRTAGRWSRWFGWLDRWAPPGEGMVPGFVWIEDDRIVGSVSVRRLGSLGRGWVIGNVAVAPDWRRRGIARSLMQAAVDLVRTRRGEWVALQVRSDGLGAKTLYESMGFVPTGETVQFRRRQLVEVGAPDVPADARLLRGRAGDEQRIYALAQMSVPESLRWAEPLRRGDFALGPQRAVSSWLAGRREAWATIAVGPDLVGAAHVEVPHPPDDGRLRLWVAPAQQGRFETALIRAALNAVGDAAGRPIDATVPAAHAALCAALAATGFSVQRRLTHMRLAVQ